MLGFLPVAYEHAAALIGETPSAVAQDGRLLTTAMEAVCEWYRPAFLPVGLDLYNIEFEALGGKVCYPADMGMPYAVGPLIENPEDLKRLKVPGPEANGRIGRLKEVCVHLAGRFPTKVCATAVGPFTLAVMLRGYEAFLGDMMEEPAFADELLTFASQVGRYMLDVFRPAVDAMVFHESWIAPPLCSPTLYREFALPHEKALFQYARQKHYEMVSLVSGGETTAIVADILKTGTTMIVADMKNDLRMFSSLCRQHQVTLRVNLPARTVVQRDEGKARSDITRILDDLGDNPLTYIGCGVIPHEASPHDVLWLKSLVEEMAQEQKDAEQPVPQLMRFRTKNQSRQSCHG